MRSVRYHSAKRERGPWQRARTILFVASAIAAWPIAWATEQLISRERRVASISVGVGSAATLPPGTSMVVGGRIYPAGDPDIVAFAAAGPETNPPWPTAGSTEEFTLSVLDVQRGWPVRARGPRPEWSVQRRPLKSGTAIVDPPLDVDADPAAAAVLSELEAVFSRSGTSWQDIPRANDALTFIADWRERGNAHYPESSPGWPGRVGNAAAWWFILSVFFAIATGIGAYISRVSGSARDARRRNAWNAGRCPNCGYNLRGSEFSERCPECGGLA